MLSRREFPGQTRRRVRIQLPVHSRLLDFTPSAACRQENCLCNERMRRHSRAERIAEGLEPGSATSTSRRHSQLRRPNPSRSTGGDGHRGRSERGRGVASSSNARAGGRANSLFAMNGMSLTEAQRHREEQARWHMMDGKITRPLIILPSMILPYLLSVPGCPCVRFSSTFSSASPLSSSPSTSGLHFLPASCG